MRHENLLFRWFYITCKFSSFTKVYYPPYAHLLITFSWCSSGISSILKTLTLKFARYCQAGVWSYYVYTSAGDFDVLCRWRVIQFMLRAQRSHSLRDYAIQPARGIHPSSVAIDNAQLLWNVISVIRPCVIPLRRLCDEAIDGGNKCKDI